MNNNNGASGGGGLGLLSTVLTIVFVVLKLVGVINWSWIWVLAPLWISFLLFVLLIIVCIICLVIIDKCEDRKYGIRRKKRDKNDKWKF